MEMNLGISSSKLGRFRVNVFRQRGAVGVVVRQIKTQIPTIDELGLPPILKTIVAQPSAAWCWSPAPPARASRPRWRR